MQIGVNTSDLYNHMKSMEIQDLKEMRPLGASLRNSAGVFHDLLGDGPPDSAAHTPQSTTATDPAIASHRSFSYAKGLVVP